MPAPTSSRLTLAPGDYSRGRTERTTAVFARGVLCTFWPQKVPKTPRQMPAPTSSRLTLAPGDYSRGRTCPVPFARAFSRAFVSRLRHRAGIVRGNSVFSAGKRSEHANMRTGANISCSLVRGESRHRPWKRVSNRRILACSGESLFGREKKRTREHANRGEHLLFSCSRRIPASPLEAGFKPPHSRLQRRKHRM